MSSVRIQVSGMVQGVGFRWSTKILANQLHVVGTIENLSDGTVLIYAKADEPTLNTFIDKVKASPTRAGYVSEAKVTPISDIGPKTDFTVIG